MKLYITFVLIFLSGIGIVLLPGCKKNSNAQFWLHLHTDIDTTEIALNTVYANPTDSTHTHYRNMTIDSGGYTITNIEMITTSGNTVNISGTVGAVADSEQYQVSTINPGTYKSITFTVSNWHVYGKVDTSAAGNGTDTTKFVHYSFQENASVTVTMPDHAQYFAGNPITGIEYTVTTGEIFFVHLIADYSKLLRGINMQTTWSGTGTSAPSVQMATNISNTFHYEE